MASAHMRQRDKGQTQTYALLAIGVACLLAFATVACGAQPAGSGGAQAPTEQEEPAEVEEQVIEEAPADEAAAESAQKEPDAEPEPERPALDPAIVAKVNDDVAGIAESAGMKVGVAVIDLATGSSMGYQADEQMVSASMIKLAVAAAFLGQAKGGAFALDDTYVLQSSDFVGGTGTLSGLGAGAEVTYREIVRRMICASDNTGTNILVRAIGMDAVNDEAKKLGLTATQLNRLMMDEAASAAGIENYTSAADCAKLLQMVHDGTFVDEESSKLMLEALEQQEDWGGVRNGLPNGVTFAHKTGTLGNVRHDGGIVEGEHPYVLVVLCGGEGFYESGAHDVMARLASATYEDLVSAN